MKTFIGLRCNKSYVKKTGHVQLYLLVGLNGVFEKIPLELDWPLAQVDENNNQLVARMKGDKECNDNNLIIRDSIGKANDIFVTARLTDRELTMPEFLEMYNNHRRSKDFVVYMGEKIKERYKRRKITWSTMKLQTTSWNWLSQFRKQILFKDLNPKLIEKFELWMRRQDNRRSNDKKKLDPNTIANVMKYTKAYINLAIDKDDIPIENPFKKADVKTNHDEKIIEHLLPGEVSQLMTHYNTNIPIGEKLTLARLLIACHLSLRISDIMKLDATKLEVYKRERKLIFHPQKQVATKKQKTVIVKIDDVAMTYLEDCVDLQIEAHKRGLKITEPYGRKVLRKISAQLGLKATGFHIGRHTFGTNYIRFGGQVTNLQYIMGHSNINTTMRYVHIVEDDVNEDMVSLSKGYLDAAQKKS